MYGYAIERGSVVYFTQEAYNDWSSIWHVLRQKAPQGSLTFSVCAAMTTVDVHACVSVSFLPSQNVPPALPALLINCYNFFSSSGFDPYYFIALGISIQLLP